MSRYYSDSDNEYTNNLRRSENIRGSGWQSPYSSSIKKVLSPSNSSSVTRVVVEPPFGSKKYDYTIDKSQPGRLVITAHRRKILSSDYHSSNNKNHVAIQTFTIPYDADVDQLQSYIERDTNRLIIEIPREKRVYSRLQRSTNVNTNNAHSRIMHSPDVERMLTSPIGGPQLIRDDRKLNQKNSGSNRKLEYRFDCHGYTTDELEVFIQGRDLIVQGKSKKSTSADPTRQHVSKKFSRKVTLPHTVDLSRVISYLDNGELRIEAPLKRGVYYNDEEIIIPGPPPTTSLVSNLENRVRSPSPHQNYRQNGHMSRRRDYERSKVKRSSYPTRRVRSMEALHYPLYRSPRELDEDDDDDNEIKEPANRHQRTVTYERHTTDRKDTEQQPKPTYKSVYSPTTHSLTNTSSTTLGHPHNYSIDNNAYLRF